ncbi:MAG: hypothetical protein JSW58_09425 [Candidatus Latescibacterota bacterium]|nr:MAG: hypothetical protein JSW58_09425 [Candidatus Latescibacterota bacterium]
MRKLVWIVPLFSLFVFSCTDRGSPIVEPEDQDNPDIVVEEEGITARFYDAENDFTKKALTSITDENPVRSSIEQFEDEGYGFESENSFVVRGVGPDGSEFELTVLAMSNTRDRFRDAVYLFCINCSEGFFTVPLRVSFDKVNPNPDSYQIDESVWLGWIGTPLQSVGAGAARMSWSQWARCVSERIAAGAAACAWICRYSPATYLQCLAICSAGQVIYALVYCTIQAL